MHQPEICFCNLLQSSAICNLPQWLHSWSTIDYIADSDRRGILKEEQPLWGFNAFGILNREKHQHKGCKICNSTTVDGLDNCPKLGRHISRIATPGNSMCLAPQGSIRRISTHVVRVVRHVRAGREILGRIYSLTSPTTSNSKQKKLCSRHCCARRIESDSRRGSSCSMLPGKVFFFVKCSHLRAIQTGCSWV